jgi:hypothetical protein
MHFACSRLSADIGAGNRSRIFPAVSVVVLLVYAGATVYFEIFSDRALAWLDPKAARQ